MRRRLRPLALIAAIVLAIGGAWLFRERRDPARGNENARTRSSSSSIVPPPAPVVFDVRPPPAPEPHGGATGPERLPHSLQETDVDGWLGVDDRGHLVVTPGARRFFDYFLSAAGEESPEQIRARIVAEIEKRLPPLGAHEAIALLDRYLAYRDRVRELAEAGTPEDLEQRLDQLHQIRAQILGDADAAAMFGDEEKVQRLDIERRQVLSDGSLSPDQRQRRLDALDQQLPADVKEARDQALAPLNLARQERGLRADGASAADIRALRQQEFGAAAADRLEALDRQQAEWQQRMQDYRTARRAIDSDSSLTLEARADAIAGLRAQRFDAQEQIRVEALDRIDSLNH